MANKEELYQLLKIEEKEERIKGIQAQMSEASFWNEPQKASSLTQEMSNLQKIVDEWQNAEDPETLKDLEIKATLSGKYDLNSAILSIHAGAGGTEAQDWSEMLLRMFQRYADRHEYKYEILELSGGEEAGIKSAMMKITGPYAFGYLKGEAGVHRLVRISPFDSDKARHTSFSLVEVIPEIPPTEDIPIDEKDLRIDVFHAGGHGGQSVNTTDSAVRITHRPSGIVVACQNERSQGQNKAVAMKVLQSRLLALKLKKQKEEEAKLRGEHISAEFGSQIRSYVLHPYKQVKDHRTDITSTNPEDVLNGNLDIFIEGYLKR
ncbi:MAG: peptide chain release factor 2 [Candidatus Berkelbacteria bacterium]|nr:peptide chain release factor 2 [Candidatus Berkelbacteria bacterium]